MSSTKEQGSEQSDQGERGLFPPDFLWGVSTSAYQIEGVVNEDGRGATIWDQFTTTEGAIHQGESGAVATDHYHRVPEDVALISQLGINAYCFSLAWARILPEGTGKVNQAGLDFYSRLLDTLLERGITPVVKLYHWDLPLALHQKGGWTSRETVEAFEEYAALVARRLGDRVPYWITHNEPWCAAFLGYGIGMHAPGEKEMQKAVDAAHHLLLSHGRAVRRMRELVRGEVQFGIAPNLFPIYPLDERPETLAAAELADAFFNRWFLEPVFRCRYSEGLFEKLGLQPPPMQEGDLETIAVPLDFLGINYYNRQVIGPANGGMPFERREQVPGASYTGMGWEIYPQGLVEALLRVHREYRPRKLLVTENGSSFEDVWEPGAAVVPDPERLAYLRQHIAAVTEARAQGAPVGGYCVWSLLDNFEWTEGYSKRFGLVYVDYPTQRRVIKTSGQWYAAFLAEQRARA